MEGVVTIADIAFIVMPPGHGKSYLHTSIPGLVGIDDIVQCRSTPELSRLRSEAKASGDWSHYDALYAKVFLTRLTAGRWVVMVPAKELGLALGGKHILSAILDDSEWGRNLEHRSATMDKYKPYRDTISKDECLLFFNNATLAKVVHIAAKDWLSGEEACCPDL